MGDLHSRYFQGNLLFYDANRKSLIDAVGLDVIKHVDDFTGGVAADAQFDNFWTVTRTEAGAGGESTITREDIVGGVLRLTTDNADNDGINAQLLGESFKLVAGNVLYFGIRMKANEATQNDFFVGLAITDVDILGGVTDRIGFEKLDGATAVKAMLEKDSTETLTASLLTLNTSYHTYEFYLNEDGNVEFFVDGVSAATPAVTNLPNDEELRLTLQYLTGEAAAKQLDIDWVRVIQIGGRA